ncbi:hypothetical protein ACFY05_32300 [Microtetraspora fusca]|uniref:Uncharacterized protein n=1 Tax=Microtetraspora fusca TaxID=1997 RepID=A0ABW6VIF9_MICFU
MPTLDFSEDHVWLGAAIIRLSSRQAARAYLRHAVRLEKGERVEILESYCEQCRRPWDDVKDEPCAAAADNSYLRGGPIGIRKKRKHAQPAVPGTAVAEAGGDDDPPQLAIAS